MIPAILIVEARNNDTCIDHGYHAARFTRGTEGLQYYCVREGTSGEVMQPLADVRED